MDIVGIIVDVNLAEERAVEENVLVKVIVDGSVSVIVVVLVVCW